MSADHPGHIKIPSQTAVRGHDTRLGTAVFLIVTIGAHLIVGYEHPQVLSPELTAFLLRMDEQGENTL
jgi:hypothetical protein